MTQQLAKAFSVVDPVLCVMPGIAAVIIEPHSAHRTVIALINTFFLGTKSLLGTDSANAKHAILWFALQWDWCPVELPIFASHPNGAPGCNRVTFFPCCFARRQDVHMIWQKAEIRTVGHCSSPSPRFLPLSSVLSSQPTTSKRDASCDWLSDQRENGNAAFERFKLCNSLFQGKSEWHTQRKLA